MTGDRLLEVSDLRVAYGKAQVLNGVDLHVDAGELVTVVGPNGAGKSTLLRALTRLVPSTGSVTFAGAPLPSSTVGTVRAGLVHCPERRRLFPGLTVKDNLELGAHRHKRGAAEDYDRVYALFPRLAERGDQAAGTLSGGEQQQLAIGRALMAQPVLLLLDEPSLGLSVGVKAAIADGVQALKDAGITMLLVEQDVTFAFSVADRAIVLENGTVAISGPAKKVAADKHVRQAYLGVT